MCLREFDWIKNWSHMLGSQLRNFLILILYNQLSDKIFLGQDKN
jgi:hypothetical protein